MNPSNLPVWVKVVLGCAIIGASAIFPYLAKSQLLSSHAHAVLATLGAMWLFAVNTYRQTDKFRCDDCEHVVEAATMRRWKSAVAEQRLAKDNVRDLPPEDSSSDVSLPPTTTDKETL